jgi:hypothetical protein
MAKAKKTIPKEKAPKKPVKKAVKPKVPKVAEVSAVGAPTKFDPSYCEQVEKLCKLGATDKDIADFFQVVESTVNLWKLKHPEFSESIKKGKVMADMKVANKLFDRATGCTVLVQQAFKVKEVAFEKGKRSKEIERVEIVTLAQEQPPDTTAAIFWLKNRQRDKWKDKVDVDATTLNLNSEPLTKDEIKEISKALEDDC